MSSRKLPDLKELTTSHIPALQLIIGMGYEYLSPKKALELRGNQDREVLLKTVLIEQLKKRTFSFKGKEQTLSTNAIDKLIREFSDWGQNLSLNEASEKNYHKLTLGISVKEFIGGQEANPTVKLIDWDNPENNVYHVTEEFSVLSTKGTHHRRPDIVTFINGIPFAVIEAKKPKQGQKDPVYKAISQHLRNQRNTEIPKLFAYSQLLLSIRPNAGKCGVTGTARDFWHIWREEEIQVSDVKAFRNSTLDEETKKEIIQMETSKRKN